MTKDSKKRAALYVRSSDPSKKDSEVLAGQIEALKAYAFQQGYEVVEGCIYQEAISAIKYPYWERPELVHLWDDAERGLFDIVLCTEMFRLARKASEQFAVMEHLKRYSVTVESITEKFSDTSEGRLLMSIQGFLGEVEAEKIHIRSSRGKRHRAQMALTGQGMRTYGYKFADTAEYKNGRYILNLDGVYVDEDGTAWTEVKVVVWIYDSCLTGMSVRQIALALTRMGIPTIKGNTVWNNTTVRQILGNVNYTGDAWNWRYIREGEKTSIKRYALEGEIKLQDGIVPKIIEPETFDRVQRQLQINQQFSARNNPRPNTTLLRGGLILCGICGNRMHVSHHTTVQEGREKIQRSEYHCKRNEGVEELKRRHCVTISVHLLDPDAWAFAVEHMKNPQLVRDRVELMRKHVQKSGHIQSLEDSLEKVNKSIRNLMKLAEVADDEESIIPLQQRLIDLQKQRRDTENMLNKVTIVEERQQKIRDALDRFEAWTDTIRPFLDDPDYQPSYEDMREALLVLGVRVTVWPTEGYKERYRLELAPPDIAKYCDFNIVKAVQYAAEKMQTARQVPVGEGGD